MPEPNEATREALRQTEEGNLNERLGLGEILANLSENEHLQEVKERLQISEDVSARHSARRESIRAFLRWELGAAWSRNPVRTAMTVYDLLRFVSEEEFDAIQSWLDRSVRSFVVDQFHRTGLIRGEERFVGDEEKELTRLGEFLLKGMEQTMRRDGGEVERLFNRDFEMFDKDVLHALESDENTSWFKGEESRLPGPKMETSFGPEEIILFGESILAEYDHRRQEFHAEGGFFVDPDFVPVWRYLNK